MQSRFRVHINCGALLLVLGSQMVMGAKTYNAAMATQIAINSSVDKHTIIAEATDADSAAPSVEPETIAPDNGEAPTDVRELFWNAREALAVGEAEKAEAIYRQILEIGAEANMAGFVYNYLGEALQAQGKFEAAMSAYEQAITIDPRLFPARTNISIAQYHMGNLEAARTGLDAARAFLPQTVETLSNVYDYQALANGFNTIGDFSTAVQVMRQAIEINPYIANAAACYFTSDAMQSLGVRMSVTTFQYRSARCEMGFSFPSESDSHQQLVDVRQTIYSAVAQQPAYDDIYRRLGLNQIPFIYPHTLFQPDTPQDRLDEAYAIAYLNLGINLLNRSFLLGDVVTMEAAKTAFQTSLHYNAKSPWAHLNLSVTLMAQGQLEEALSSSQQGLSYLDQQSVATNELVERPAWAYNLLGTALELNGDVAGAVSMYQQALQLDRTFDVAQTNLERLRAGISL
ncbi:MAG: tetratricopeptide repeat protein [Leptolyngbyaceae cyanobacterium MAG.088]|nr:tetratricopeptide repeat protein [Leptolyngbyaceae cyanobacterium MAG.088]